MLNVEIKQVRVYDKYIVRKEYHLDFEPERDVKWYMDSAIEVEQCLVDEEIEANDDPVIEVVYVCPVCGDDGTTILTTDLSGYCLLCRTTVRFCVHGISCNDCRTRLECIADSGIEGGFPKIIRGPSSTYFHKEAP